jgi:hypothetical protein
MLLELSVNSCPVGPELHPSFDASCPPGRCPQSHEILSNKGMKYWCSALNAPGSRGFRATVQRAAAVIGWMRWAKERTVQTQFSTKLLYSDFKLDPGTHVNRASVSFPVESQCTFFSCILKSLGLCDQTRGSGAIFSWLYG